MSIGENSSKIAPGKKGDVWSFGKLPVFVRLQCFAILKDCKDRFIQMISHFGFAQDQQRLRRSNKDSNHAGCAHRTGEKQS